MTHYNPDALIKIVDLERTIPTESRGRLYNGYQVLIEFNGRSYLSDISAYGTN
jgi:hypothetical protein